MRREEAEVSAEGVFVVVVVVVTDKEYGGSEGRRRRKAQNLTPSIALLPFGEGEMAGLAALAALALAVGCHVVTGGRYAVVKVRGDLLMEQTLRSV